MVAVREEIGFAVANFDWDSYLKYRPIYPQSLFQQIYKYHSLRPGNKWDFVHDAGSGAGIVAEILAAQFARVAVSDPNPDYIAAAAARLSKLDFPTDKFSFHQAPAEDQSWLDDSSLDMFTIFTAIGYADVDKLMQQVALKLRPGGTLAVVNYNGWPAVTSNDEAAAAWSDFGDQWLRSGIENGSAAAQRGFRASWSGHDSIGVPDELFERGTVRVKINDRFRNETSQILRFPDLGFLPNAVGESDLVEHQEDLDGWARTYTLEENQRFVGTLACLPSGADLDRLWRRLREALDNASHETLRLQWSAEMILATRRGGGPIHAVT